MAIVNFAEDINSSAAKIIKHLDNALFDAEEVTIIGGNPGSQYLEFGNFLYEVTYAGGGDTVDTFTVTKNGDFFLELLDLQISDADLGDAVAAEESGSDNTALETLFFGLNWVYNGNDNADLLLPELVSEDGVLINLTGDDEAYLNGGDDDFFAGDGSDYVEGGAGKDTLRGGNGDDELHGGGGADKLFGQAGDDTLDGGSGKDSLKGGAGNDHLIGAAGNDTLNGGSGFDTASYTEDHNNGGTQGIDVNLGTGVVIDTFGKTDTLTNVERILGSVFDDNMKGSSDDDALHGEGGGDTLKGKAGDDHLMGGEGDDIIKGGADWDVSDYSWAGTQGIDVDLTTGIATDQYGDTDTLFGIEEIWGSQFDDVITGDDNNNALWGHQGNDVINAGGGDDNVAGSVGDDIIDGGDGWDIMHYDYDDQEGGSQGIVLNLSTGVVTDAFGDQDMLSNIEEVWGSVFNDQMLGDDNDNSLRGQAGDDLIDGADGDDYIYGNSGNDEIYGGDGDDFLFDGDGVDEVVGGEGDDYISAADDSDNDVFDGGDDRDMISYANVAEGVTIDLLANTVTRNGIAIGDTIVNFEDAQGSDGGGDTLYGTGGQNTLDGRAGDDLLHGRAGNDYLVGARGDDVIDGGDDHDIARYDYDDTNGGTQGIDANMGTGVVIDAFGDTDTLIDIEGIWGTVFADKIVGNDEENFLSGFGGADTLKGKGGDDYIEGGNGADLLVGGAGNDELDGGKGADTLKGGDGDDFFVASAGNDSFIGGSGFDVVSYQLSENFGGTQGIDLNLATGVLIDTFGNTDSMTSIEAIIGSTLDDSLVGDGDDNQLSGGGGNDVLEGKNGSDALSGGGDDDILKGGKGADILNGGFHNDMLFGGKGADELQGANGDDVLTGGRGNDTLSGGNGIDIFVFNAGDGDDVIEDFDVATDLLEFTSDVDSIVQQGDDVLITHDGDETVLILNTDVLDFE